MSWDEIRTDYVDRWLLVEALEAHTEGAQRVISNLTVIGEYADYYEGWDEFKRLHTADKWREYYVLHTAVPRLKIGVLDAFRRVVAS